MALFASLLMYVVILWVLRWQPGAHPPALPPQPALLPAFAVVAVVVAALSVWLPGRMLASARMRRASMLPAMQTALILGCALSEAVALFGFTLGFLGFSMLHTLPFFTGGFVLMALRYPSSSWAERHLGS